MEKLIKKISWFKLNVHRDAYDNHKSCIRIYRDDTNLVIIKFNNMKTMIIEWECRLDMNMPEAILINTINAMIK